MLHIYFYGKGDYPGHKFYKPGMVSVIKPPVPWGWEIDGKMQPRGIPRDSQPLGCACLHYKDGWTMLSFWDRSGDPRPNSNGNFIVQGTHNFETMLSLAQIHFPTLMARIGPLAPT